MCICHFWENVSIQFNLLNEIFYPIFLSRFICLKYSWIAGKGRAGFAISRNCSRSRQISVKSAFCFRYFSCFRSLSNRPINYKNILIAAENITRKRLQGKICVDCFICKYVICRYCVIVYIIAILIQSTHNNSNAFMKLYNNRCITNIFAATTHYSSLILFESYMEFVTQVTLHICSDSKLGFYVT